MKEQEILAPLWDYDVPDQIIGLLDERIEEYAQQRVNEVLDALNESQKDLIVTHGNIYSELKRGNKRWEGVDEIIYNRIESNRKFLKLKKNEK